MQYHNDYLSIEENEAVRQQKLEEDLNCPPLPLREAWDDDEDDDVEVVDKRRAIRDRNSWAHRDPNDPDNDGPDEEIEEADVPAGERTPEEEGFVQEFRTGYDHGYSGKKHQPGGVHYSGGYMAGQKHKKEGLPHSFDLPDEE